MKSCLNCAPTLKRDILNCYFMVKTFNSIHHWTPASQECSNNSVSEYYEIMNSENQLCLPPIGGGQLAQWALATVTLTDSNAIVRDRLPERIQHHFIFFAQSKSSVNTNHPLLHFCHCHIAHVQTPASFPWTIAIYFFLHT